MAVSKASKTNIQQAQELRDTGFSATGQARQRYINEDGTFNVKVEGRPFLRVYDIYHELTSMSWLKFNFLVLCFYFIVNLIFACIYYAVGLQYLRGISNDTPMGGFMDAFFFSAQTLTTVGYGRISPVGMIDNSISSIESLCGLLGFALATGLIYGRFSKPVAKIARSNVALIAPYRGGAGFMFRIANQRRNNLNGAEIVLTVSLDQEEDGKPIRKFYALELEMKRIELFPLPWTVVHPINERSPIYDYNKEELEASDAEFLVSFKAYDESFAQNVLTRFSYKPDEIVWGAKFKRNFEPDPAGYTILHLDKISEYEPAKLPDSVTTAETQI